MALPKFRFLALSLLKLVNKGLDHDWDFCTIATHSFDVAIRLDVFKALMTCHDKSGKPDLLAVRYTGTSARVTTGEPRTDGELAEIRLTLKKVVPQYARQMEKVLPQTPPPVLEKDFPLHLFVCHRGSGHFSPHFLLGCTLHTQQHEVLVRPTTRPRLHAERLMATLKMLWLCWMECDVCDVSIGKSKRRMLCDIGFDGGTAGWSVCVLEHRVWATKIATSGHRA